MPRVQTSESTNRMFSGKYKRPYASAKRLKCLRTLRMATCPRVVENQGWKPMDANQGWGGRFVANLGRKEGGRIKHPSPPHLILCTHCWKNISLYCIQNICSRNLTDLLHSQLIACTMQISEFKNKWMYTFNLHSNSTCAQEVWSLNQFICMCWRENNRVSNTHIHTISCSYKILYVSLLITNYLIGLAF